MRIDQAIKESHMLFESNYCYCSVERVEFRNLRLIPILSIMSVLCRQVLRAIELVKITELAASSANKSVQAV